MNTSKGKPNVDSDTLSRQKRLLQQNWSSIKSDPDFQAATDTDSAIMLEDHIAEVSFKNILRRMHSFNNVNIPHRTMNIDTLCNYNLISDKCICSQSW